MSLPNSDDEILFLHNPRCSKSRATKELLDASGVAYVERQYLEEPLGAAELRDLGTRLGLEPKAWTRSGEAEYAEQGLSSTSGADELIDAIAKAPKLMQRPIVVRGKRAKIGRPPEDVRELF